MSRWIAPEDDEQWGSLFTTFRKSAFHFECQQVYSNETEDAALVRFLAGQPHDLDLSWVLPKLEAQIAAGHTHTTVRVVVHPLTDYTRLQLAVYPEIAAAGEDIRIVAVADGEWPADLPTYDYWLFDERDVWRMHYHADHTFRGAELVDSEGAPAQHLQWRDTALSRAVSLRDYLSRSASR